MSFEPLLSTRISAPSLRPDLVARPRLVSQLEEGLLLGHRLSLVAAPAGFGKTTLISEWLSASDWPVAWLTVDETCSDPSVFFSYLMASLSLIDEQIGHTVLPLLESRQELAEQSIVTALINNLAETDSRIVIVVDDYHSITSFSVHDALSFLVENQPPGLHVVIGTREDPPLPLSRFRARGLVTEIRESSLKFTQDESTTFFRDTMKLNLGSDSEKALDKRTEGWVTGLQLAGLALRNEKDAAGFVAAFAGSDRFIMDYLMSEVVDRESEQVRNFLRTTSILDRLTAPLCNALTGNQDGQTILDHLESANLFLIPIDRSRTWFRYHQLFAEVLRLSLSDQELTALHGTAREWYEASEDINQAAYHALESAKITGDMTDAERLARQAAGAGIFSGLPSQPLIEPLSERELEVLSLINQGYSNAEIAQQLYIAIGTVKRHINNIYGKLEVKSRTQAIVKARELHLLDNM
jgi:LuxR family maltose regulon positive regulatory protein